MIKLNELYGEGISTSSQEENVNNDLFSAIFAEKEDGWVLLGEKPLLELLPKGSIGTSISLEFFSEEHGVFGKVFIDFTHNGKAMEFKGDPSSDGKRYPGIKLRESTLKKLVQELDPEPKIKYAYESDIKAWKMAVLTNGIKKIFRASLV